REPSVTAHWSERCKRLARARATPTPRCPRPRGTRAGAARERHAARTARTTRKSAPNRAPAWGGVPSNSLRRRGATRAAPAKEARTPTSRTDRVLVRGGLLGCPASNHVEQPVERVPHRPGLLVRLRELRGTTTPVGESARRLLAALAELALQIERRAFVDVVTAREVPAVVEGRADLDGRLERADDERQGLGLAALERARRMTRDLPLDLGQRRLRRAAREGFHPPGGRAPEQGLQVIHGHAEVQVLPADEHGRRNPDDLAAVVEERSPRGARRDGRGDLQDAEVGSHSANGADETVRDGVLETERVTDGDHRLAGTHAGAVARRERRPHPRGVPPDRP